MSVPTCSKCGNTDIGVKYHAAGERYSGRNGDDQFVSTNYVGYYETYVNIEHLFCKCNVCGHSWRQHTKDHK